MSMQAEPEPTIELPLRLVLDWLMSSDPMPLSDDEAAVLELAIDTRCVEIGYEAGWVEAFHRIGCVEVMPGRWQRVSA
jgi:hypothetical protein